MSRKKSRKDKEAEYLIKYGGIPNLFQERLIYMLEKFNINESMIHRILVRKKTIEEKLRFRTLRIIFYEVPEASKRPRFTSKGFKFYVPDAADDRARMKVYIKGKLEDFSVITTPMIIDLKSYFSIPTNFSKEEKILAELGYLNPIVAPDWDNIAKKYTDMQNTEIFIDDSLIIDGRASKHYSSKPRIELTIYYMNGYISKTQYNSLINRKSYLELLDSHKIKEVPEFID